jgi:predicted nuclease of predicted toxin-antitoxin system
VKVLLDSCVWGGARQALLQADLVCEWVGDWESDPGDVEILTHAFENGQVLVTLDKDFGELAVVKGELHRGIIRLVGFPARSQGEMCCRVLDRYADEIRRGALVTATPQRVRLRIDEG